jgi:hypothetical protein
MNVLFQNRLFEVSLDNMQTSGITNKSIQKNGTGRVQFIKAILNGNQSLHLLYEVESSHDDNKHFSVNGQLMQGLQHGYAVQLHFTNIDTIVPFNFLTLSFSAQQQILQAVFDKADVKVQCDCGAFYWQGFNEQDDKKGTSYLPFTGTPGEDTWAIKHDASGAPPRGQIICKHLWAVKETIDQDIPVILKYLGSGQNVSSSATVEQPTEDLKVQEQPAGLPQESKQGVPKETTINSPKADAVINADIEAVKSNNELQQAPTLDTSEVEAKSDVSDTEAQEGTEPIEPPIEKPEIPKELADQKEAEKESNLLELPLDTETKKPMNENLIKIFNDIYSSRKI